jgi:hypothetical protein
MRFRALWFNWIQLVQPHRVRRRAVQQLRRHALDLGRQVQAPGFVDRRRGADEHDGPVGAAGVFVGYPPQVALVLGDGHAVVRLVPLRPRGVVRAREVENERELGTHAHTH